MNTNNPLMKKKIFLFITDFLSGISVMGVETAASRLLAPYFTSSQIVWTLIIGTILIAMSIGNVLGGRLADKCKDITKLYILILIAGAYICLIPFFGRYIIAGVTLMFAVLTSTNLLIWASLFTCLILFVPPLLVMGMVTPALIKYTMGEYASGKIVGQLESISTIGSIIGTFLPTFVFIPWLGTSLTFGLFGGLIVIVALTFIITGIVYNNMNKEKIAPDNQGDDTKEDIVKDEPEVDNVVVETKPITLRKKVVTSSICSFLAIIGIILCCQSKFVFWGDSSIVYEDESIYNYLQVSETDEATIFSTNVLFGVQSINMHDGSLTGGYFDYALASLYMADIEHKDDMNILVLGNGAGTFDNLVFKYFPTKNITIDGVEIDKKINTIARKYFNLDERVNLYCDDGRNFLKNSKKKYDIILVDAYSSISVPFQMATVEFYKLVKKHLTADGVALCNVNMKSNKKNSFDKAMCDTLYNSFNTVYHFSVPDATNDAVFVSNDTNIKEKLDNATKNQVPSLLKNTMRDVYYGLELHKDSGIRMTDDKSDVEIRSMNDLDDIIQAELRYYKKVYRESGFKGLLEELTS